MGKKVTITEYAKKHKKERSTIHHKVLNGKFKTAEKIGNFWVIDEDEPYTDLRVKSGKYKNWRKKKEEE